MFDQLSVGLWRSPLDIGFFVMIKKKFFFLESMLCWIRWGDPILFLFQLVVKKLVVSL